LHTKWKSSVVVIFNYHSPVEGLYQVTEDVMC